MEVGPTLAGALSEDEIYAAIHAGASDIMEVGGFYIALYDEPRDLATVVFYADRGDTRRVEITYRGSDSEVIRSGEASLVEDRSAARALMVLGEEHSEITRSAVSAPMIHGGRVIGVISSQSYRPSAYDDDDLDMLQTIAGMAAVAIVIARRVAQLERRRAVAEQIEALGRALAASLDPDEVVRKVVSATLQLIESDGVAVFLVEGDVARVAASGGGIELPLGAEWKLAGVLRDRLLRDRVPSVVEDLAESKLVPDGLRDILKSGSGMAAPLIVSGEVAGVLAVGREEVRGFGEDETEALQRLTNQASVALENARLNAKLQALSLTDPLTGLANRRHLKMHLDKEVAAANRGRAVALAIFDLDDFKGHNNTLGHLVGDQILVSVAKILADEARATSLVTRYGGDEFVTVLSDSDAEGAAHYVHRVRERVATDPVLSSYGVEVSIGLAGYDPAVMSAGDDLLRGADEGLYDQKEARPRSQTDVD